MQSLDILSVLDAVHFDRGERWRTERVTMVSLGHADLAEIPKGLMCLRIQSERSRILRFRFATSVPVVLRGLRAHV